MSLLQLLLSRAIYFSYFAFRGYFANVFAKHTKKYWTLTIRVSHFRQISYLLMPGKNKPQNHFSFCANSEPGANCCEMWKAKKGTLNAKKVTQNTLLYTFCFSHFMPIFAYFLKSVLPALRRSPSFVLITLSGKRRATPVSFILCTTSPLYHHPVRPPSTSVAFFINGVFTGIFTCRRVACKDSGWAVYSQLHLHATGKYNRQQAGFSCQNHRNSAHHSAYTQWVSLVLAHMLAKVRNFERVASKTQRVHAAAFSCLHEHC